MMDIFIALIAKNIFLLLLLTLVIALLLDKSVVGPAGDVVRSLGDAGNARNEAKFFKGHSFFMRQMSFALAKLR